MKEHIKSICLWLIRNFYSKPKAIVRFLISGKRDCRHQSYFPEFPQKSIIRIWIDQLIQCLKFGYPNEFYFPYGFDVKSSKEMSEYLHYAPFMRLRDKNNCKLHSGTAILRDKLYFGIFTDALGINSGKNIGVITGSETFVIGDKNTVSTDTFLRSLNGSYILKPIDGECGSGIFKLLVEEGKFRDGEGDISIQGIIDKVKKDRYLVQQIVVQHPLMASLHPESLNTMRLVTIRDQHTGKIVVFPSILRIGTGHSFVDNTSKGGLAVAVDLETGHLGEYGFYKPEYGTRTRVHPDSGIVFSTFRIPFFKEAKEQAIKLHSMLPTVQSIGWDIAIGERGPVFIEGNDNWEINGPQICNGPLKERFYKLSKGRRVKKTYCGNVIKC